MTRVTPWIIWHVPRRDNLVESWRRRENVRASYEICQSRRGAAWQGGERAAEGDEGDLKRKRERIPEAGA